LWKPIHWELERHPVNPQITEGGCVIREGCYQPIEVVWGLDFGSEDKVNEVFLLVDEWRATCRRQNYHLEKSTHPNPESCAILRPRF
jgi:hypothetical protein